MPTGVYKVTDIPEEELTQAVAGYMLNNPIRIEKIRQPDGKWTVIVTYSETVEVHGS